MPSDQSSHLYNNNFLYWKIFGIWGGRTPSKYYKYYSMIYIFITLICYFILLTLDLYYTPRTIELIIQEIIFYFTEISVASKAFTIILLRDKIIEILDIIDSDEFLGDYENKDGKLYKVHVNYNFYWKVYVRWSNVVFFIKLIASLFVSIITGSEFELPVSRYYFLSDENRRTFYVFWYLYQSCGMYGHMIYNVNIDSFFAGLLYIAIAQLRLLNSNLSSFELSAEERKLSKQMQDKISIEKLNGHLRHYDAILKYCETIQEVFSTTLFIQFSIAAAIICVVMCGLLLLSSTEMRVFLLLFLITMAMQIFLPALLGTELAHESQEIVTAAYSSDWIPRSEPFKRSLRILMHRANIPITFSGQQLYELSLATFIAIMKTAYSLFTLVRTLQEE